MSGPTGVVRTTTGHRDAKEVALDIASHVAGVPARPEWRCHEVASPVPTSRGVVCTVGVETNCPNAQFLGVRVQVDEDGGGSVFLMLSGHALSCYPFSTRGVPVRMVKESFARLARRNLLDVEDSRNQGEEELDVHDLLSSLNS